MIDGLDCSTYRILLDHRQADGPIIALTSRHRSVCVFHAIAGSNFASSRAGLVDTQRIEFRS